MTTQQLTEYLPRPHGRTFKRRTKLMRLRTERLLRAKIRKARSLCIAWYRRQYFLTTALADFRATVKRNEDIYLAVLMIAVVLGYAYAVVAAQMLFIFFGAAYALADTTGMNMGILSLITLSVLGVSLAWVAAFASNALSLSLMHGASNKKIRSLRRTLREGLRSTARTTTAWALVSAAVAGPLLLAGLGTIIYFKAAHTGMHAAIAYLPYIAVVGVSWALYALMQFSLVPQVSLFESQLSFGQAFGRSRQLVRSKGKVFLSVLYCAFALSLGALYGISVATEKFLRLNQAITFVFGLILLTIFTNGMLTVFYRKRRLARK